MNTHQLNDIIKSSKNVLIVSHINPDGDTLGSMTGLFSAVKDNLKKECDMFCPSKIPAIYKFLPYIDRVKNHLQIDKSREYDLVINVDIAAKDRAGDGEVLFDKAKFTVNIDHHKTNKNYGDLNIVKPQSSSCSEVLFDLLEDLNWVISPMTAEAVYTGILTDTGGFRFDNTKAQTLKAASKLVEIGVKPIDIYKKVYESNSKNHVLFQAYCISKAVFENNDRIAYTTVYEKDIEKFSAEDDCTEGLTEKLRAIVSTEIAFVVRQMKNGGSKVSMRSKNVDVAEICSVFGGGGHTFAAGCVVKASVDETVKKILTEIKAREI